MKKDIVERLREASGYALMDAARVTVLEAADEIERLRAVTEPMPKEKRAEVCEGHQPPTLTDAERDAIEGAIIHMETRGVWAWPATLRGLLERLK